MATTKKPMTAMPTAKTASQKPQMQGKTNSMQKNQSPIKAQASKAPAAKAPATSQRNQYQGTKKSAEFAKDMTKLDDLAIVSDILVTEKNLVKLYGGALTEVSCEKLRKLVNSRMSECAKDQFDVFLYMNARNQYPTEPAPAQKVSEAKQKFNGKCQKMKI